MPRANCNGIELEYETFGTPGDSPILLIMGLGAQMTMWDESFCDGLRAEGHFVIRYDARDTGLSTRFESAGIPDIAEIMATIARGGQAEVPYLLDDMADDAAALLSALELDAAHVVGASMGGMVAQALAIRHPERVLTLTSIMSTTGSPDLPPARPEAMARLMRPAADGRDGYIDGFVETMQIVSGSGFPFDAAQARERAGQLYDRSFYPVGQTRHTAAVVASGSRKEALGSVRVPTLVIHGTEDPLVPVEGGIDTHESIPGSELMLIEHMGHGMPEPVVPQLIQAIAKLTARV